MGISLTMGGFISCGPGGRSRFFCPTVTRTSVLGFRGLSSVAARAIDPIAFLGKQHWVEIHSGPPSPLDHPAFPKTKHVEDGRALSGIVDP